MEEYLRNFGESLWKCEPKLLTLWVEFRKNYWKMLENILYRFEEILRKCWKNFLEDVRTSCALILSKISINFRGILRKFRKKFVEILKRIYRNKWSFDKILRNVVKKSWWNFEEILKSFWVMYWKVLRNVSNIF